jgi:hypothetical protein
MIESAEIDELARDEAAKRDEAEKRDMALQAMQKILIHGLGDELRDELKASGATIKTDPAESTANLLLQVNDTALQVVVSSHPGPEHPVKALVHLYQTGTCVLNGKAHHLGPLTWVRFNRLPDGPFIGVTYQDPGKLEN